jgi:hypothetical protein
VARIEEEIGEMVVADECLGELIIYFLDSNYSNFEMATLLPLSKT